MPRPLESRMVELFNANRELHLRENELAQRLGIESALLLGALATVRMATVYGEEGREFHVSDSAGAILGLKPNEPVSFARIVDAIHPLDRQRMLDAIAASSAGARTGRRIITSTGSSARTTARCAG